MRNYNSKDLAPQVACVTVKMFEKTYSTKYSNCESRNDLPYESGYVYALVPIERLACDALLEIWGVSNYNSALYVKTYACAAEILSSSLNDAAQRLPVSTFTDDVKEKILNSIKVVDTYQKEFKKRGLDLPEPFDVAPGIGEDTAKSSSPSTEEENPLETLKKFINEKPEISNVQLFFEMLSANAERAEEPVKAPAFPLPPVKIGPYIPEKEEPQKTSIPETKSVTTNPSVPVEFEGEVEFTLDEIVAGSADFSAAKEAETPTVHQPVESASVENTIQVTTPQEPINVPVATPVEVPIETPINTNPSPENKTEGGFKEIDFGALISVDDIFGDTSKKTEENAPAVIKEDNTYPTSEPVKSEASENNSPENTPPIQQGFVFEPIDDIDDESDEEDIYAGLFS